MGMYIQHSQKAMIAQLLNILMKTWDLNTKFLIKLLLKQLPNLKFLKKYSEKAHLKTNSRKSLNQF
jgi:hypothetical protein